VRPAPYARSAWDGVFVAIANETYFLGRTNSPAPAGQENAMNAFILSRLVCAYSRGSDGLLVGELLLDADCTLEAIQTSLDVLEGEGLITSEKAVDKGDVYRLRVFANIEALCQGMPRNPGQAVIV
jgi:hypothetical protein